MVIAGREVAVRPARASDGHALRGWLGDALNAAVEEGAEAERLLGEFERGLEAGAGVYLIEEAGAVVGAVRARLVADGEAARFDALVVRPEARRRGIGAKALALVEEATGARRFLAETRARDGRALYFWLRLGYRPIYEDGRVVMERFKEGER
ncbi:MAG: GNAT family N-acetyltransferase [Dehalococcoidia bacterium]|nr:GNAT family N-acetyltransferase [Dehalococcoidia bacterium]